MDAVLKTQSVFHKAQHDVVQQDKRVPQTLLRLEQPRTTACRRCNKVATDDARLCKTAHVILKSRAIVPPLRSQKHTPFWFVGLWFCCGVVGVCGFVVAFPLFWCEF